jgi:hypothetical protein
MALGGEGALGNAPRPQGIKFLPSGSPNSSNFAVFFYFYVMSINIKTIPVLN